ncbi:MAG: hypothetical protein PHP58_07575 [Eubacteriales bacterium]|nr:hypothetical protein [Eubacteriales bacterium]
MKKSLYILVCTLLILMLLSAPALAETEGDGYWELIGTADGQKDYTDTEYHKRSLSGSNGSWTIAWEYAGPDESDWYDIPYPKNGENSTGTGSISAPPRALRGGQKLSLNVNVAISSSYSYFFDSSYHVQVSFDGDYVEQGYCTASGIRFLSNDPEYKFTDQDYIYVWMYGAKTERAKNEPNRPKVSTTVTATAPFGQKDGDLIAIHAYFGDGGSSCRTKYTYQWHESGASALDWDEINGTKKPGNKTKKILTGIGIIGGGGAIGIATTRKIKKKKKAQPQRSRPTKNEVREVRDFMRKQEKKGDEAAGNLADQLDKVLEASRGTGKINKSQDYRLERFRRLFQKYAKGQLDNPYGKEVQELEKMDGVDRYWHDVNSGIKETFGEVSRGDSAKSIVFRAGMATLTGGASEAGWLLPETYYTWNDAIEAGDSDLKAGVKSMTNVLVNYGGGKVQKLGSKLMPTNTVGKAVSEGIINKAGNEVKDVANSAIDKISK